MQAQAKSTAWPPRSMCYMPGRGDKSVATDATTVRDIASEAFAALDRGGQQIPSFSARYPSFTLDDAYRVTTLANGMRVTQGYKPLGRKAGFTNRQMWKEYGVGAPNWGYVYDRTLHDLAVPLPLAPYSEPKIEPEIMFGLAAAPWCSRRRVDRRRNRREDRLERLNRARVGVIERPDQCVMCQAAKCSDRDEQDPTLCVGRPAGDRASI